MNCFSYSLTIIHYLNTIICLKDKEFTLCQAYMSEGGMELKAIMIHG